MIDDIGSGMESFISECCLDDSILYDDIFQDYSPNNMTDERVVRDWRKKCIIGWSTDDILHWVCDNSKEYYENIQLENFTKYNGSQLLKFSKEDFMRLSESDEIGMQLYNSKEQLKITESSTQCVSTERDYQHYHTDSEPRLERLSFSDQDSGSCDAPSSPRRKPGRPKSSQNVRKKSARRTGKLWEFLRNLLLDSNTNPKLIKWDDYKEGTFKFVNSDKVAKLWGGRKNNENMNYEKLSRAMRYYYKSQILLPVPGKRLVYKFGPKAVGWKTDDPIL